ncbi:2571_t:CDS:2 [Gigaspora rosea]|nr:2571_t:CDS:2 [Gigaspora rosea]
MIDGWLSAINKLIDDGNDLDKLGRTIDPDRINNDGFEDNKWKAKYGIFHAMDNQQVIDVLKKNPDVGKAVPKGLIGNGFITAKDPAFYRWHHLMNWLKFVQVVKKIDGKNMLKKIMHKFNILEPVATKKLVTLKSIYCSRHDRKQWIEMDKFKVKLNKSGETIISHAAELSSVIRKLVQKVFDDTPGDDFDNNYCGCSWPCHLLLPHGTREGMKFKLFVFILDWNVDKVPDSTEECSLSMCGRKIANKRPELYPDAHDI